ncbi:MAG: peptidoglycan bridge formation glycyltransferase FemA/FemB family protein [Paludibacteraceae bacterium]|nr:peptidoglycan bridge formation glycyltransferase FemA/FemB family protein [Paludibacteraceae bacterium]
MQEVSKNIFYQEIEGWAWVSHTQLDTWCRSLVPEDTLHYFLDETSVHAIGCVGFEKRKAGLKMLIIHGECIRENIQHSMVKDFYANIAELGFDIIEINSDSVYNPEYEIGMREAGLLRPVGLFSTTLSKWIDLTNSITYDKNWKRNLKKAEHSNLSFQLYDNQTITDDIIAAYIRIQQEMTTRKGFSENLNEKQLRLLLSDCHFVLGTIWHENNLVSGMVAFIEDGKRSMSLYSASSLEGRKYSASYLLRLEVMRYAAQQRNIPIFDMGRLSPAKHAKNDIYLFKNGIDGSHVQYNGEWLWCKQKWMPLVLYFMKKYIWKRVQV